MRVVIALGVNALLRRGERPDAAPQVDQVAHVAGPLAADSRRLEDVNECFEEVLAGRVLARLVFDLSLT